MIHFYDLKDSNRNTDVEICMPVGKSLSAEGGIQLREVPGVKVMAYMRFQGELPQTYVIDDESSDDPAEFINEVQFPIEKI